MKKKLIYLSFVFFFVLTSFSYIFFLYWLNSPLSSEEQEVRYNVMEGTSFEHIAHDLAQNNVISHPRIFMYYARFLGLTRNIKAGTYIFQTNNSPQNILLKLSHGDVFTVKFTIPEGFNIYQVSAELNHFFPQVKTEKWLAIMHSQDLIHSIFPNLQAQSVEGFLFPQTYFINPSLNPQQIVKLFLTEFKKNLPPEMLEKSEEGKINLIDYVTLASIVEKETAQPSEREHIAGVYLSRLKIGMRLQADPTVIYGVWNHYAGTLTKKDLLNDNPYNTYRHNGLPPGPIANPGIASLLAVLNPTGNDLYFVAKGDGSHIFTNNLSDHNKAVKRYIHFLNKRDTKEQEVKIREQEVRVSSDEKFLQFKQQLRY